jgi:large subunit ribosomal protein L16
MNMLKLKYNRYQKRPMRGLYRNRNNKNSKIVYGSFGLKSLENGFISFKHLESARKVLSRRLKKIAKV